jgi:Fibronectin type III domain
MPKIGGSGVDRVVRGGARRGDLRLARSSAAVGLFVALAVVLAVLKPASASSGRVSGGGPTVVSASRISVEFSVGTFYWGGLFSMSTFAFHNIGDGLPSDVTITGPNGWNSNVEFQCHLDRYPGMAPGLGLCLAQTAPWQGTYTARLSGQPIASATLLPITYAPPAPFPRTSNVSSTGVTVSWTPDARFRSYLIGISEADAGCCQAATVSPAGASAVDLRTSLVPGRQYAIELQTFPVDLTTADGLTSPWNVSSYRSFFTLQDDLAPAAHAITSYGGPGGVRLRYSVSDNSGKVYVVGFVTTSAGRRLGSWRTGYVNAAGVTSYYRLWHPPWRLTRRFRFCVTAYDAAGNASPRTCAGAVIRG